MQKSSDDGASWSLAHSGLPSTEIGPFTALASDPNNPQTVIASTQTGLFVTTNGGDSWSEVSAGMEIDHLAVAPTTPASFYITTCYRTGNSTVFRSSGEGTGISWQVFGAFPVVSQP